MTTIATKYPFVGSVDSKQGGRKENQDNAGFVDTPLGLLLVVCDGMGGGPGGRTASLMAVDTMLTVISNVSEHTPRADALKYAIDKANDIIYAKAKETPELRGMGTTVAAILINEDSAVIAHAGDTRVYQLRKGTIVFRSSDHSVVANLVRQKKITEEEARNHPQSNIVTRALGIRPSMEIEFDEVPFLRGDRFVICTDGIWGMIPQRELVKSLSRVMGIGELTASLTEEIDRIGHENGGGHDNLTLAIVDASFDSSLKKIKKEHKSKDPVSNFIGNKTRSFHMTRHALILLIFIIVSVVVLFLFLSYFARENKISQGSSQKKGITITTVNQVRVKIKEDTATRLPDDLGEQVVPNVKYDNGNPFQDPTIKDEQNQAIAHQINRVIKSLDSLEKIRGKNRNEAQKEKKEFVRNVLVPGVSHLGKSVNKGKEKDIKDILKLLNDRKTVQSSNDGQTTAESKQHIKILKNKVKRLQN